MVMSDPIGSGMVARPAVGETGEIIGESAQLASSLCAVASRIRGGSTACRLENPAGGPDFPSFRHFSI